MLKAVEHMKPPEWVRLYVERWLKAPAKDRAGNCTIREKETPQGSVISPVLANLFLQFAFDQWMKRRNPGNPFERYADDMVIHCRTYEQAQELLEAITGRLTECNLTVHPEKTKIVYCKDGKLRMKYTDTRFKFLGFDFRSRVARSNTGKLFLEFGPGISREAEREIKAEIRCWKIQRAGDADLNRLSELYNSRLRGWYNYYGEFRPSEMYRIFCLFTRILVKWAVMKSRMMGDYHVRFRERLGVQFPRPTRPDSPMSRNLPMRLYGVQVSRHLTANWLSQCSMDAFGAGS